ncbi:hypothetical protein HU200_064042 [Digitaria exilis]|uniref:Ubiquitin-like protease family profile domain-containing protein n=1 Tax=Digitaria exilis TaxID=1010633 RepID=A0A835A2M4_9POAL|nr:hypothetical protein HU200_064042 [Digitaria exilis]
MYNLHCILCDQYNLDLLVFYLSCFICCPQIFLAIHCSSHYCVYCINLIHNRIDILDSLAYFWIDTNPMDRHAVLLNKMPLVSAVFQKATGNKVLDFGKWKSTFIDVPKQAGPNDCMFFAWKYMEFWDGERLHCELNPMQVYVIVLLHFLLHALNQAELPEELDIYGIGGRKIQFDQSQ